MDATDENSGRRRRRRPSEPPTRGFLAARRDGRGLLLLYCGPVIAADALQAVMRGPVHGSPIERALLVLGLVLTLLVVGITWGAIRSRRKDIFRPGWIGAGALSLAVGLITLFQSWP